jgi:hypothetical protein
MDKHNPHDDVAAGEPMSESKGELFGVLAEFDTPGELVEAARKVREAGYTEFDCYSPFPVHGIDEAMGIKRTILPLLVFGGGFTGLMLGLLLQWWTNAFDWPWLVSADLVDPGQYSDRIRDHNSALGLHHLLRDVDPQPATTGLASVFSPRSLRSRHR